jgi:vacuolar protein sorting-associated protein 45
LIRVQDLVRAADRKAGAVMAAAGKAAQADLVEVVRNYVDKMLKEVPGMKVLLLDAETTRVVSTVFSQSEILEQEVYLVERLDADKGDQLFHLKARRGRPTNGC